MSMITDGRGLLLSASQPLDDLAPSVAGSGDPEELGQLLRAESLEAEADQRMAEAHGAPTAQAMAASAAAAEEHALQAEQLRQQAKAGLEARVANASKNMDTAEEIQSRVREAVEGTPRGDDMVTTTAGIHAAIEETKTGLAQAAEVATEREQTHACIGLIQEAGEAAARVAGMCHQLRGDIDEYAAAL